MALQKEDKKFEQNVAKEAKTDQKLGSTMIIR